MTTIRTERLNLRPISPKDVDPLYALMSYPEVARMTGSWPIPADREFALSRCQPPEVTRGFVNGVWHEGEMIGMVFIIDQELGYAFSPPFWGQGYASEAATAAIDFGFEQYPWDEICAGVWIDNPASVQLLTKLGFENRPDTIGFCVARGEDLLSRQFALTRLRYESLRNNAA